jgi:hypothetical protein
MSAKAKVLTSLLFLLFVAFLISNSLFTHADSCTALKEQVQSEIDSAIACKLDSDCASYTFDCAFGCAKPVTKSEIEKLGRRSLEYARMCHHFCPDCEARQERVACVESVCRYF